jgi:hypothetical protein
LKNSNLDKPIGSGRVTTRANGQCFGRGRDKALAISFLHYPREVLARAGGLIGYGVDFPIAFRREPITIDKILRGAKPDDLPFQRATRFECVINLKTAKALGIDVPTASLLRPDEVIEEAYSIFCTCSGLQLARLGRLYGLK